jgi:hypothetical protein
MLRSVNLPPTLTNKRNHIPIYIQQDATLHNLFCLETVLHVSGGTTTHHQERKQLSLQHLAFVTPLLLPAAIVEELELVPVCCGWRTVRHPQHTGTKNSSAISTYRSDVTTNIIAIFILESMIPNSDIPDHTVTF